MGLLGETGGLPDEQNPLRQALLMAGLGILANNNNRRNPWQAIGMGGLQGMNAYQQMIRQQKHDEEQKQEREMKQQQFDMQQKVHQMQLDKLLAESGEPYKVGNSLVDRKTLQPIYTAPDQPGSAQPYYSPYDAASGALRFNHRTGAFEQPDGTVVTSPITRATNSPEVRGAVKGAETQAKESVESQYDVIEVPMSDGTTVKMPRSQFLDLQNANKSGKPFAMDSAGNDVTGQVQFAPQNRPVIGRSANPVDLERGKAQARADVDSAQKVVDAQRKKESSLSGIGSLIDRAKVILTNPDVTPTHSAIGNFADAAMGVFGMSNPGAEKADALKAIAGALVSRMPRMEGPQSNYDVENYKAMAGDIGNPSLPISRRLTALQEVEAIYRKYDQEGKQQIIPQGERMDAKPKSKKFDIDGKSVIGVLGPDGNYYVTQGGKKYRVEE